MAAVKKNKKNFGGILIDQVLNITVLPPPKNINIYTYKFKKERKKESYNSCDIGF